MSSESAAPVEGPRAIVAGHGDFAAGLVSAVEQITGRGRQLHPARRAEARRRGHRGAVAHARCSTPDVRVIFTDLQAGSCTMASRRILRGMDDAVLVAGANLPTLLDFVFADSMAPVDAARHAAERGQGVDRRHRRSTAVTLELFRIDDRLIHGQVVVGWGQPLDIEFIVLVDDAVATSDWEQELYRMGVPPEMDVYFHAVDRRDRGARRVSRRPARRAAPHRRHRDDAPARRRRAASTAVNVGGIHSRAGRVQRLRYVFLVRRRGDGAPRARARGVTVTAQDVPGARPRSARRPADRKRPVSIVERPSARVARRPARARRRELSAGDDLAPARRRDARRRAARAAGERTAARRGARADRAGDAAVRRVALSGVGIGVGRRRRDLRVASVAPAGAMTHRRARRARHDVGRRLDDGEAAPAERASGPARGATALEAGARGTVDLAPTDGA